MYKTEVFEAEDLLVKNRGIARYFKKPERVPVRFWVGAMIFLTTYVNYSTRVNMSISIVAMSQPLHKAGIPECKRDTLIVDTGPNATTAAPPPIPDYGPRYAWDQNLQAHIIAIYFVGYCIASLLAGLLSEMVGPFRVVFWSHVVTLVLNALCVVGTWYHYSILLVLRFLIGACGGLVYPALQSLIARWAPPAEKGKFVSALMGNTLGTCITWPVVGTLTQTFGWDWGFYFLSVQLAVFSVVFFFVGSDGPENHPWISEEEKNFIQEAQGGAVVKKKTVAPYKSMFTSIPFWALTMLHVGNLWGLYLQLSGVPKFMSEVIGFNLRESGGLAALPHLMRLFFGLGFGSLGDFMKRRNVSAKFIRKFFVLFSHIIPGIALMCISLCGCQWMAIVGLLVISMSVNGAAVLTNLQNPQDLAPNFAGSIFGIISFFAGLTGFITPVITGWLTYENNGIHEWVWNFVIGGSVYIGTGIIFILIGSVERQSWNEKKEED